MSYRLPKCFQQGWLKEAAQLPGKDVPELGWYRCWIVVRFRRQQPEFVQLQTRKSITYQVYRSWYVGGFKHHVYMEAP